MTEELVEDFEEAENWELYRSMISHDWLLHVFLLAIIFLEALLRPTLNTEKVSCFLLFVVMVSAALEAELTQCKYWCAFVFAYLLFIISASTAQQVTIQSAVAGGIAWYYLNWRDRFEWWIWAVVPALPAIYALGRPKEVVEVVVAPLWYLWDTFKEIKGTRAMSPITVLALLEDVALRLGLLSFVACFMPYYGDKEAVAALDDLKDLANPYIVLTPGSEIGEHILGMASAHVEAVSSVLLQVCQCCLAYSACKALVIIPLRLRIFPRVVYAGDVDDSVLQAVVRRDARRAVAETGGVAGQAGQENNNRGGGGMVDDAEAAGVGSVERIGTRIVARASTAVAVLLEASFGIFLGDVRMSGGGDEEAIKEDFREHWPSYLSYWLWAWPQLVLLLLHFAMQRGVEEELGTALDQLLASGQMRWQLAVQVLLSHLLLLLMVVAPLLHMMEILGHLGPILKLILLRNPLLIIANVLVGTGGKVLVYAWDALTAYVYGHRRPDVLSPTGLLGLDTLLQIVEGSCVAFKLIVGLLAIMAGLAISGVGPLGGGFTIHWTCRNLMAWWSEASARFQQLNAFCKAVRSRPQMAQITPEDLVALGDDVCPICVDAIEEYTEGVKTPCGHIFHRTCLQRWMYRASTCPKCLRDLTLHVDTESERAEHDVRGDLHHHDAEDDQGHGAGGDEQNVGNDGGDVAPLDASEEEERKDEEKEVEDEEAEEAELGEDGFCYADSDQEGEKEKEKLKAGKAFDACCDSTKCVSKENWAALLKRLGTTYSEDEHGGAMKKMADSSERVSKRPFVEWYTDWLFDGDDESEENADKSSKQPAASTIEPRGFGELGMFGGEN